MIFNRFVQFLSLVFVIFFANFHSFSDFGKKIMEIISEIMAAARRCTPS
jgi:hypothetical protein